MLSLIAVGLPSYHCCAKSSCATGCSRPASAAAVRPNRTCSMAASEPLFSFGVISDVQYADIPDGASFHGVPRYYRNSLTATRRAVQQGWVPAGVQFGIHFGDILDGYQPKDKSEEMLQRVIDAFDLLEGRRTYHMIGNHCLYNLPRTKLNEMLHIPPAADGASYYSFSPHPAWRFVVIDSYDISLLGWPDTHPRHLQAEAILAKENPNQNKNMPEGLVGVQRRFVMFGGGVSQQQLQWLEQQIQDAGQQGQSVVVCSHLPIYPDTCPPACLVWNYNEVLAVLQSQPGVVVASIAGHTHQNGYLVDAAGIHHMVLPGVVEAAPGRDCYGVVEVYQDRLEVKGVDTCMSCCCKLPEGAVQRQQQAAALQQQQQREGQQQQQQQPQEGQRLGQQQQQGQLGVAADVAGQLGHEVHQGGNAGESDAVVDVCDDVEDVSKAAAGSTCDSSAAAVVAGVGGLRLS